MLTLMKHNTTLEISLSASFIILYAFLLLIHSIPWSGKKSKSVFNFLTYSGETGFSFSYEKVRYLIRLIVTSNEIERVYKFDNSLSFGGNIKINKNSDI